MSIQSVAKMAALWAEELLGIVPAIDQTIGGNSTVTTELQTGLNAVKQTASDLATAEDASSHKDLLTRLGTDWEAVSGSLQKASLPPQAEMAVSVANAVVPAAIGIAQTIMQKPPAAPAAATEPPAAPAAEA